MSQASPKFKPGDIAKCMDNGGFRYLTYLKKYIVIEAYMYGTDEAICIRNDDDRDDHFFAFRFNLANDKHLQLKRFIETGEGNAEEVIKLFRDT